MAINFSFKGIPLYCFFETFPGGWELGLIKNSDFSENPVVNLDLDFDLGFVNIDLFFSFQLSTEFVAVIAKWKVSFPISATRLFTGVEH